MAKQHIRLLTKLAQSLGIKEVTKAVVADYIDSRLCRQIRRKINIAALSPCANNKRPQKVLFFTVQGRPNMLAIVESILACSVNLRGAQSEMVVCDKVLPLCDLPFAITEGPAILCKECCKASGKIFDSFNLPWHPFSSFINKDQLSRAQAIVDKIKFEDYFSFKYLGIDIGKHVYSAVLRFLLQGSIDDSDETKRICRKYMVSAIIMAEISSKIIGELKPDAIVMHHGIYLTTGIFADFARKNNIHVIIFTPAYRKNTFLFSHNETYHKTLQDESLDAWQSSTLTPQENETLDNYLESRRWGSMDFITYHPNPMEDKQRIISQLGLDTRKKTIGLFTNLVWDGQVVFHDTAFKSMLEWVLETIGYFAKKNDLQLIVRIHPAEVNGPTETRQKLFPEIQKAFPNLPENIKIINSSSDISTYTLSELTDVALVYTTKVGLEFAVKGIPVIVAGEAFYRSKGFTYDPDTRAEYFSLLDNLSNLEINSHQRIERARKYAYYYFFKRFIPFDLTVNRTWNNVVGLKIAGLDELLPGKNKYLDLICSGILENTPFIIDGQLS